MIKPLRFNLSDLEASRPLFSAVRGSDILTMYDPRYPVPAACDP